MTPGGAEKLEEFTGAEAALDASVWALKNYPDAITHLTGDDRVAGALEQLHDNYVLGLEQAPGWIRTRAAQIKAKAKSYNAPVRVWADGSYGTQGYKRRKGRYIGVGVYVLGGDEGRYLFAQTSVSKSGDTPFTAELRASSAALDQVELLRIESAIIYSDCKSLVHAVERIQAGQAREGDSAELIALARRFSQHDRVKLRWQRGHNGTRGNDIAHCLANHARRNRCFDTQSQRKLWRIVHGELGA